MSQNTHCQNAKANESNTPVFAPVIVKPYLHIGMATYLWTFEFPEPINSFFHLNPFSFFFFFLSLVAEKILNSCKNKQNK